MSVARAAGGTDWVAMGMGVVAMGVGATEAVLPGVMETGAATAVDGTGVVLTGATVATAVDATAAVLTGATVATAVGATEAVLTEVVATGAGAMEAVRKAVRLLHVRLPSMRVSTGCQSMSTSTLQ